MMTEIEPMETERQISGAMTKVDDIDYYKVTDMGAGLNLAFIVSKKIIIKEWKRRRTQKLKALEAPSSIPNKFIKL
jgi:hypothetical protein